MQMGAHRKEYNNGDYDYDHGEEQMKNPLIYL